MIDRIYKLIQTVSNNELNGNISPQEFKLELHNSVVEIYENNLFELNRIIAKERRGLSQAFSIENLAGKFRERIMYYYVPAQVTKTDTTYPLPSDLRYLDTVEHNGVNVDSTKNRREFKTILNFVDTMPGLGNPIFLRLGNVIDVAPATISTPLDIYYLRNPKVANWTYVMSGNTEIFNPSANDFQDVDIHPSEEYNVTIKLLQKLGINLNEKQITEYGLRKDSMDFQSENVS